MTTCDSRFRGVVNTYDCDQPAGHDGPHQTHHSDGELTTWDDRAVDTPRESAPSAATARPRVELARALDRETLRRILDRLDLGKIPTPAERHALRAKIGAEQDDCDRARDNAEDALTRARGIATRLAAQAVAFQDVLDDSDRDPWAHTIRTELDTLLAALNGEPQATERAERNAAADVAAARQAEQQAGATLVTRHRQLAAALGLGALTSWPDLIETARRVFEAGPVRRAAVVDAEQALDDLREQATADLVARSAAQRAAEQRARDTAATLRETEQQLAEARARAGAAKATLAAVRTAVAAARACMTALDLADPAQCLHCGADHLAATEAALAQPPADPCDCGQTDCTTCHPIQCATPAPGAEPPHCTCAGVGFGTGTCAVHYPPETAPPAEPPCFHPMWQTIGLRRRCTGCREWLDPDPTPALDGAALWDAIRDHQFWDRLMLVRGRQ